MKTKLSKKTINAIYRTEKKAEKEGRRACHLFNINDKGWVVYTGHIWDYNNFYTLSDMIKNNDTSVDVYGEQYGVANLPVVIAQKIGDVLNSIYQ